MTADGEPQPGIVARPGVLASFAEREFRKAWLGAVLFGLGMWMERLAIGWFVLDQTGSVFLAALSFAIRTIPNLVFGPIAGAASDRLPRARILTTAAVVRMVAAAVMSAVVFIDIATVPLLFTLVFVTGSTIAFQSTALQPLQADIVGPERLGNAISLTSFGQRSIGVVGALSGGVLIGWLGPGPTFLIGAGPLLGAALMFASVRSPARRQRGGSRFAAEVMEGLRLLVRTPMVRLLLGMMILVEILGFSYNGLLPAVADRVLEVGPERLGVLSAGAAVGSMLGMLLLVVVADRLRRGLMLVGVFMTFGALLVVLGNSTAFWLSVLAVGGIGASAAMVDALEWIMLQDAVPLELRGRALGGWNFAIGWGWIGPITLGAIADATGVPAALTLSGTGLLVTAVLALIFAGSLRSR
ncbi:MAG: MFS transporter [Dehalococcoidia bacterium]|jgi:predicted MFS family arabinose efflux permease|nr:MFS transporter [Dehalococcoidia bacterium]